MPAPTLSIPDLPEQLARLMADRQLGLRSMFVGEFVAAAAFDLLIFVTMPASILSRNRAFA